MRNRRREGEITGEEEERGNLGFWGKIISFEIKVST